MFADDGWGDFKVKKKKKIVVEEEK